MIRILSFLAIVVLTGGVLAFVAAQAGDLVVMAGGYRVVLPLFTAVCLLLGLLGGLFFLVWFVRMLVRAPGFFRSHFGGRRRDRGYQALSQGLIAAMSGDVRTARRLTKQSSSLLGTGKEPLLPLLVAETKRLEQDYQGATDIFQGMLEDPQMRLIGLKGLYREAVRSGDETLAGHYATEALKSDMALEWALRASMTKLVLEGDWAQALALLDRHDKIASRARTLDKSETTHWRVVLLCAQAASFMENFPYEARDCTLRAQRLEPDFVPAATLAARSLFRLGERKRGERLIEAFWRKRSHPDLGHVYLEAVEGLSAAEKLRRAMKLEQINPEDNTAQLLVARVALQAGDPEKARQYAQKLVEQAPSEAVFRLLADIQVVLDGDRDKIRDFMEAARHAPADPVWIADGQIMHEWVPISPLSHRIGACFWQQPVKQAVSLLAAIDIMTPDSEVSSVAPPVPESLKEDKSFQTPSVKKTALTERDSPPVLLEEQGMTDSVFPPRRKKRSGRSNSQPPPIRLVVDDPGIDEDESENGL